MSETVTMPVEEQVTHLCGLLKEYAEKLVELKRTESLDFGQLREMSYIDQDHPLLDPLAWWLDECHRMKKPLLAIVSSASQTLEHLPLDTFQSEELTLRLAEIEVHLHHVLRRFHYWNERLAKDNRFKALMDPLRASHGLPAEVTR